MAGDETLFAVPLRRLAAGELPPNVALMQLLMAARDSDQARAVLDSAREGASPEARDRIGRTLQLLDENPAAHALIHGVLARIDHRDHGEAPDRAVARMVRSYDAAAELSPAASSALYALGNPEILAAATAEVVQRMRAWDLLGPERDALEIGCGAGRFLAALAPEVRRIVGLDLSPRMLAAARAETAGHANVEVRLSDGRGLGEFADASFNLVLAADSFPYLVQAGVAEAYLAEIGRVLRPGGDLLILNYSYRGDVPLDEADLVRIGPEAGLEPVYRQGPGFAYWDAASFNLRRPAATP